ncbi:MAG: NUDIX hydrolase [Proteobacteria bacterium]|nr:NUDIX hydrolase [Pseudomonadota bacterium]
MSDPAWLRWVRQLQAIAQTGLHYAKDRFDIERYEQTRAIAAAMMAAGTGEPLPRLTELFSLDKGYRTPKVGLRAAVFQNDRILMVRETHDDRWSMPGGWADVNQTAARCVEREVVEESGFTARAVKLAAVWEWSRHAPQPFPFTVYYMFFLCELTGGAAQPGLETTAVDFFAEDALPELSPGRMTEFLVRRMFEHHRHPDLPTDFD